MNVVIIEDEKPAAEKLLKAILKVNPQVKVVATLSSVAESIEWLHTHDQPDLLFMDIELGDGLSFKIFETIQINSPVIFCTAYDEYWQEAFEHSGIDYLLKPVKQEKLVIALQKYDKLKNHFAASFKQLQQYRNADTSYKKRFLVKRGIDYVSIRIEDIAYFYATQKVVCLIDSKNQKFILDQSLADIEKQVDPALFYRVNRKYLVQSSAIKKIRSYPKSKLQLELEPVAPEEIIISQESTAGFKEWMGS